MPQLLPNHIVITLYFPRVIVGYYSVAPETHFGALGRTDEDSFVNAYFF